MEVVRDFAYNLFARAACVLAFAGCIELNNAQESNKEAAAAISARESYQDVVMPLRLQMERDNADGAALLIMAGSYAFTARRLDRRSNSPIQ